MSELRLLVGPVGVPLAQHSNCCAPDRERVVECQLRAPFGVAQVFALERSFGDYLGSFPGCCQSDLRDDAGRLCRWSFPAALVEGHEEAFGGFPHQLCWGCTRPVAEPHRFRDLRS